MNRNRIRFFIDRFFRRPQAEEDLEEELQSHLGLEVRQRIERGESADSARQAALREFGNVGLIGDVTRDKWGFAWLEELARDCQYAVRMLRKSAGLSMIVIVTLALGISTTTAIFTLVERILLRPLPFPSPDELVMIWEVPPNTQKPNVVALENFVAWKERSHSFESMAAFWNTPMNLMDQRQRSEQVPGLAVTSEFFAALGTPPLLGRTFRPGEYWHDKPREAILSYRAWQSRFGGNPEVIGKRISVDVTHLEIIGVMPAGFGFPNVKADLYVPLAISDEEGGRNFSVIGRLKRGVSVSAAMAGISTIAAGTARENVALNAGWSATVVPLLEQTVGSIRPILLLLLGATGLIVLLVCANVANLLLMHSTSRTREISVRLALGARTSRILRQLFTENLLLAASGGAAGIVIAGVLVTLTRRFLPETLNVPRVHDISPDGVVLAFAVCVTAISTILFGLAPAVQLLKRDLVRDLHASSRSVTAGRRLRSLLVIAEVTVAVILVVGSGLMVRSFIRLIRVNPGFHAEHVLTVRMLLLPVRDEQFHAEVVRNILGRVRALPGVIAAGSIGILPMEGTNSGSWYYRADRPEPEPSRRPGGHVSIVTPGYFSSLEIPILRGRDFDEHDRSGSVQVAILNQTASRLFFPREDAIGKRMRVWWNHSPTVGIVGVAGDIRHSQLTSPPEPCLFMPNDQQPFPFMSLVVRTSGDPAKLTGAIQQKIREVDSDQGIAEVGTMSDLIADSVARPRVESLVLTAFGVIAVILACMGLYGVIAYSVAQRSREIGIRLTLGATASRVFRSVLMEGLWLAICGLCVGGAAVVALVRYLRSLLFEVQPTDPVTISTVVALIVATSVAACYWPARRATRIDPAVTLRDE
jgi:putative ABC transport system permease protein